MGVGAQSGFEVAFQEFVYYAGPIIQLVYWLAMIIAALWAVTLLRRWVEHQTSAKADVADPALPVAAREPVSVDEFVE